MVYKLVMFLFVVVLRKVVFERSAISHGLNDRPIIAILAQISPYNKASYIAASYVKYLESSGARVVPIPASMSDEEVEKLFESVNGVLFPGGKTTWFTSAYYRHAKLFYDKAITANKQGDFFPIWGTCLGFEMLHVLVMGNASILGEFASQDITLSLSFTDLASDSRLFKNAPRDLYKALASEPITYNHHKRGISPDVYKNNKEMRDFYDVLSINDDLNGKTFVSTVEAKQYPFYGTQWHPERNSFEFIRGEDVMHTKNAVLATQYVSNFFVDQARRSMHKFSSETEEQEYLIYNYLPVYTEKVGLGWMRDYAQVYYFN